MTFITEPNLYRCIFQSRKKEAEQFQDWVFEHVLPSIRKTGRYEIESPLRREIIKLESAKQKAEEDAHRAGERASCLKREMGTLNIRQSIKDVHIGNLETKIKVLEGELKKMITESVKSQLSVQTPMGKASGEVCVREAKRASEGSCTIQELARILRSHKVDTGYRRLLVWLRSNGYLCASGADKDMPTPRALDKGLLEVVNIDGAKPSIHLSTRVTEAGRDHILNKFLSSPF